MPKEVYFQNQHDLFELPNEKPDFSVAEYPKVKSRDYLNVDMGVVRLIQVVSQQSQNATLKNFEYLSDTELQPYLPEFAHPLYIPKHDAYMLVIPEFAPDNLSVAVRSIGPGKNTYTGNTRILDEAELFFRQQGMIDTDGFGKSFEIEAQGDKIVHLLKKYALTVHVSAISVVVGKTNDQQQPFHIELKLRDLSQVRQNKNRLMEYPIYQQCVFWGMVESVLSWHRH